MGIPSDVPSVDLSLRPSIIPSPIPSLVYTSIPSNTPSNSPTIVPTDSCVDAPLSFSATGGKFGCEIIATNQHLCGDPYFAGSHCPVTCNACEVYKCVDSTFEFAFGGGHYFCSILSFLDQSMFEFACGIEDIRTTCRESCHYC